MCTCNITSILAIDRYNHPRMIRFIRISCCCAALSPSRCVLCAVWTTNAASSRSEPLRPAATELPVTQNVFIFSFILYLSPYPTIFSFLLIIFVYFFFLIILFFFVFVYFLFSPYALSWFGGLLAVRLMASLCHVSLF